MSKYLTYKDAISQLTLSLPQDWKVYRAKGIFNPIDERSEAGEEQLLSVSEHRGVVPRNEMKITMFMAESYEGYKLCQEGDLVINSLWAWGRGIGVSEYSGIVSTAYGVFRQKNKNQFNPYYLNYLLRTKDYVALYYMRSKGIWISRLQLQDKNFLDLPIICPPKSEQDEIVQNIKAQEEKINLFIQKKQRFIELLKEQKDLIAFSAINMDGLKNGCPERRIKSFSQILRGKFTHRPRNDERLYEGEYPFIQTGEVSQANKYINGYRQTLNDWGYSVSKEFPKGTLCLTIAANVGDVAILNFNACFPDSIVGIVPNDEVDLDFLYHALKSLKAKFLSEATLTTQYNLNVERIGPIKIPIPNLETQKKIVTELETETATIDTAIAKAEREIELIREYKEAMISEAVMGKRKLNFAH